MSRSEVAFASVGEEFFYLRDYLVPGGGPHMDRRNAEGLDALISDVAKARSKPVVRGHPKDVYRVEARSTWTFPSSGLLSMEGSELQITPHIDAAKGPTFAFSGGWTVEGANFVALPNTQIVRFVEFLGKNQIDDCTFESVDQMANSRGLLDYAIRILRGGNTVNRLSVKGFDKALLAYGADGDGHPGFGNLFRDVYVEQYVTAFELRNLVGTVNQGFRCFGRSPNATQDPGQNGLLHSGVADYALSDFHIADAGEHGCRFGGTRYSEQKSQSISVTRGTISRSGQSGLKFFTGKKGQNFTGVQVEDIDVIDCQYLPTMPKRLPGFNDEGFLLQQLEDSSFSGLRVRKSRSITGYSCDCAVYVSGATNLKVLGIRADSTFRDFIRISQWDDGTGRAPIEKLSSRNITIDDAVASEIGGSALFLDFPDERITDSMFRLSATGVSHANQESVGGHVGVLSPKNIEIIANFEGFPRGIPSNMQRPELRTLMPTDDDCPKGGARARVCSASWSTEE